MRVIEFKIDKENEAKQIRDYLREFGVSSSLLKKLKSSKDGIMLNGSFARSIDILSAGDTLKISIKNSGKAADKAVGNNVGVIYNDEDILVLNKPAAMPVHESRNHRGDTLANVAACYTDDDTAFRAVYRLDRDTSGLVLIAKNELAACKLAGKVKKDYYAVCSGVLSGDGVIDMPIRRVANSIIKRGVFDDGERAVTHWHSVEVKENRTLLRINLETGRTHQIRVHFSHIAHPLVGDTMYGGDTALINRQALHCKTIYFTHPVSCRKMKLECDFPQDFKGLI